MPVCSGPNPLQSCYWRVKGVAQGLLRHSSAAGSIDYLHRFSTFEVRKDVKNQSRFPLLFTISWYILREKS